MRDLRGSLPDCLGRGDWRGCLYLAMAPRPPAGLAGFVRTIYGKTKADDVAGAAAELAYRFFLALFPFIIFIAALGGFAADLFNVANPSDEIMAQLEKSLPADAASVLRKQLDSVVAQRNVGLASAGFFGTLLAASGGVGTIMKSMNRAYGLPETRSFVKRNAVSLGLTLSGGVLLLAASVLFIAGQIYGLEIADRLGMSNFAGHAFAFARWPAVFLLAVLATAAIYWAAPSARPQFRLVSPGALFFAVGWLGISYVFTLYVDHFGSYNATYGTLGGVVVAMVWFYITGYILLVGGELNAALSAAKARRAVAAALLAAPPPADAELGRASSS